MTPKQQLVQRVMEAIRANQRDPFMDRTRCETALRRMGMKPGNAQRLLDDATDVQVSRVLEAARLLRIPAASLFERDVPLAATQEDDALAQALEVLGIALARTMPDEVREDVAHALSNLAKRRGQERDQAMVSALLTAPPEKQRSAA